MTTTHVEELIANPQRHFAGPADVLEEPTLTFDEKKRILESWKLDAQRLAESTAENMSGGEESDLRDVSKVLVQLKEMKEAPEVVQPEHRAVKGVGRGMGLGALIGAGAGLVIMTVTGPSLAVIAEAAVIGMILGGVAAVLRNTVRG